MSVLAAIIFIAVQFKMVARETPGVLATAVVDDRSLLGEEADIKKALKRIAKFDSLAGHCVNEKKCGIGSLSGEPWSPGGSFKRTQLEPRKQQRRLLLGVT